MKTLIVLPSWGRDEYCYKNLIATTPKDYKVYVLPYEVICPDRKIENIEKNLIEFIKSKKLKSVELLGHSLGGTIGLLFAANHPEYISKLILVDAKAFKTHSHLFTLFPTQIENLRVAENFGFAFHLVFKTALKILFNPGLHGKLGLWAIRFDANTIAYKITVPTAILWGESDKSIPVKLGKQLHALIPNSTFTVIPSGSHEWILHHPEFVWKCYDFIKSF